MRNRSWVLVQVMKNWPAQADDSQKRKHFSNQLWKSLSPTCESVNLCLVAQVCTWPFEWVKKIEIVSFQLSSLNESYRVLYSLFHIWSTLVE